MAAPRSHLALALRRYGVLRIKSSLIPLLSHEPSTRTLSSDPDRSEKVLSEDTTEGDLRSRIFRLRFPKRSATATLDRWVEGGGSASTPELRRITGELRRAQRYKHALETCEWMINHRKDELEDYDYADKIDLITKVFGLVSAEEFFEGLPSTVKTSETYTALLHAFTRAGLIEKAESLFERIKNSGLVLKALTFNEMMTFYMSAGQFDKVFTVVEELKANKISPDLFTYNLWISACAATADINAIRSILDKMRQDSNFNDGWMTYSRLIEIYISAGPLMSAENSLIESEKSCSTRDEITYDLLIILHSGLNNKERVGEIWKSLRMTSQKMTSRNYTCILSSYLVLGQFKEAGDIIDQWRQSESSNFDISACNSLFNSLVKVGLNSTAQAFHQLMIQKNCSFADCNIPE